MSRQRSMEAWLAARAEAGRLIAEYGKRPDWREWAEAELVKSPHSALVRKMLSDQLTPIPN